MQLLYSICKERINLCMVLCLIHNYRASGPCQQARSQCPPSSSSHQGPFEGRLDGGGLALVRTPTIFKRALSTSDPIKPCRPPSTAHKPAVVSTLLKRVASHCSMNSLVRKERSYVKEILQQNGYPERFLSPQCSPSRKEKDDPRSRVTIPYIQGVSEAVTKILSDINVQVHMKPFRTLRRILSHPKDHIPDDDKSSVVYKINCRDCDASYVGEMGRALQTRVSEHRRAMEKMDFSAFALVQHAWEHDHHIDWTSTCVLGVLSLTTSQEYPERQSTSAGSPLPSIGTEVPCLICMILSYCDYPSLSQAKAIQLKVVTPYDYGPISLDSV